MWIFATYLPLMIGHMVPEDDDMWQYFLLLLDILKVSTCQIQSLGLAGYLEVLVSNHHHSFIRCYPRYSVTPKLHYCVHLPSQIIRYMYALVAKQCIYIITTMCLCKLTVLINNSNYM